jgi:hypothetical protein
MWPFKKKNPKNTSIGSNQPILFSQVDTTERFDDNVGLTSDDWIATIPLNTLIRDPELQGLPAVEADGDVVYQVATKLSRIRESIPIPNDGVYCPTCHIANVDIGKLGTPCPKCSKPLLKFGWD